MPAPDRAPRDDARNAIRLMLVNASIFILIPLVAAVGPVVLTLK